MVEILNTLEGFKISFNDKSKRIIDIRIQDQIIEKLIFPFNKFNIIAQAGTYAMSQANQVQQNVLRLLQ